MGSYWAPWNRRADEKEYRPKRIKDPMEGFRPGVHGFEDPKPTPKPNSFVTRSSRPKE